MNTTSGGFGKTGTVQGTLMNDPNNGLEGELDNLNKEDLKERLIVAEKVMKSLFQRNKDLEEKYGQNDQKTSTSTSDGPVVVAKSESAEI